MTKKLLIFLLGLLSAGSAWALSSFSMGFNDTIWYNPNLSPNGKTALVHAQMDARVDSWDITFTYPNGMGATTMIEKSDMRINYVNSSNETATLLVGLFTNAPQYTTASASISEMGYWYNPIFGVFECYGTVKWEPGYYNHLFEIWFSFASGFNGGNISMDYHMRCSGDNRGNTSPSLSGYKQVTVLLGNRPGDVNGDDKVDNSDVTLIVGYALNPGNYNWDEYQLAAADIDGSGVIDITDATLLIQIIMSA